MGTFSWADMDLGSMLDANIYINNDFLLCSVMMVMVVWRVLGRTRVYGLGSGEA